ncbi:hypothetical protein [Mucilaginibacter sp. HD30]
MLRKILLVSILILSVIAAHSQTLKITDVSASDQKLWNNKTKALFGKTLVITTFDKAVRLVIPGHETMVLKQSGSDSNEYKEVTDAGNETQSYILTLQTTMRVVTSATFVLRYDEKNSPYRSAALTITAKRF